jgi:hypothetical protein
MIGEENRVKSSVLQVPTKEKAARFPLDGLLPQ